MTTPEREQSPGLAQGPTLKEDMLALAEALAFYGQPDTYFAVGFLPDPPCGDFMDDFSPIEQYGRDMPGKRARAALSDERLVRMDAALALAAPPAASAAVEPVRSDGMPASAAERHLRRMLCATMFSTAYMDDGEASDCSTQPHIDFMRDSVEDIDAKLRARGLARLRTERAATAVRLTEEQRNAAIHAAREGMHVPHTPGEWNRWLARTIERAVLAANGLGEQPGSGT